ncbi:hypothetical protein AB4Z40_33070 [Bosea sp. 2YAB26]|uniref:hypothetical protein n=1 Tax=Bosea sp. 2YAB26 TaxID=3237478 RepID=UPI003F901C16
MSSPNIHPAASHHLPSFITAPGETDYLMVAMAVVLVVAVLTVGIIFFRLHTLPERMAHKSNKLQFEIVAVLGLLALFTHIHLFWVAGLLLALIELPDFSGLFGRMAHALERIAGSAPRRSGGATTEPPDPPDTRKTPVVHEPGHHARQKEPSHA